MKESLKVPEYCSAAQGSFEEEKKMPDFEELQRKKAKVINAGISAQSFKSSVTEDGFVNIERSAPEQKGREKYQDTRRKKYISILTHDFTGQKWIAKDKKDRKARRNINENFKLVTGIKKDLTGTQQQSRKDDFETRRDLSYLASNELADFVEESDNQAEEWTGDKRAAIAKELFDLDINNFDFDSDETFLKSFKINMHILAKADRLENVLLAGDKIEGFDMDMLEELSVKLSRMGRIREAYEDRIQIISSPYYVSLRTEDMTLSTLDHLNMIAKGEIEKKDVSLKSFAAAITRWKFQSSKLFTMGKTGNKEHLTDTIAENIILKNGIEKVNDCFNSFKLAPDKNGNTKRVKRESSKEMQVRDWIYGDLKMFKKLNRKQISDKIAYYISKLEETNTMIQGEKDYSEKQKDLIKSARAI